MYEEITAFGRLAGELKRVRRKGWMTGVGVRQPESVADHVFRTAVLTMCVSDMKGLDTEKLVRMALLHDLHEAVMGDYDHAEKTAMGKDELERRERSAIQSMISRLPQPLQERYRRLAFEYLRQETKEAQFLRQLDRLEMIMQALEYERAGYDRERLQRFWDDVEGTFTPEFQAVVDILKRERA